MESTLKTFVTIGAAGLIIMIAGCAPSTQQANEDPATLEKEVMAIHDEIMPRMGEIEQMMEDLGSELSNAAIEPAVRQEIVTAMEGLALGDSLMWDWMYQYKVPEDAPADTMLSYLKAEMQRIEVVREQLLSSMEHADRILQKLGHGQPQ
jgi:hypothetical protein